MATLFPPQAQFPHLHHEAADVHGPPAPPAVL